MDPKWSSLFSSFPVSCLIPRYGITSDASEVLWRSWLADRSKHGLLVPLAVVLTSDGGWPVDSRLERIAFSDDMSPVVRAAVLVINIFAGCDLSSMQPQIADLLEQDPRLSSVLARAISAREVEYAVELSQILELTLVSPDVKRRLFYYLRQAYSRHWRSRHVG